VYRRGADRENRFNRGKRTARKCIQGVSRIIRREAGSEKNSTHPQESTRYLAPKAPGNRERRRKKRGEKVEKRKRLSSKGKTSLIVAEIQSNSREEVNRCLTRKEGGGKVDGYDTRGATAIYRRDLESRTTAEKKKRQTGSQGTGLGWGARRGKGLWRQYDPKERVTTSNIDNFLRS